METLLRSRGSFSSPANPFKEGIVSPEASFVGSQSAMRLSRRSSSFNPFEELPSPTPDTAGNPFAQVFGLGGESSTDDLGGQLEVGESSTDDFAAVKFPFGLNSRQGSGASNLSGSNSNGSPPKNQSADFLRQELNRTLAELRQAKAALDTARGQNAELKQDLSQARDEVHLFKTKLRAAEAARDDALTNEREARADLVGLRRQHDKLQTQFDAVQLKNIALEKALSASSGSSSPNKGESNTAPVLKRLGSVFEGQLLRTEETGSRRDSHEALTAERDRRASTDSNNNISSSSTPPTVATRAIHLTPGPEKSAIASGTLPISPALRPVITLVAPSSSTTDGPDSSSASPLGGSPALPRRLSREAAPFSSSISSSLTPALSSSSLATHNSSSHARPDDHDDTDGTTTAFQNHVQARIARLDVPLATAIGASGSSGGGSGSASPLVSSPALTRKEHSFVAAAPPPVSLNRAVHSTTTTTTTATTASPSTATSHSSASTASPNVAVGYASHHAVSSSHSSSSSSNGHANPVSVAAASAAPAKAVKFNGIRFTAPSKAETKEPDASPRPRISTLSTAGGSANTSSTASTSTSTNSSSSSSGHGSDTAVAKGPAIALTLRPTAASVSARSLAAHTAAAAAAAPAAALVSAASTHARPQSMFGGGITRGGSSTGLDPTSGSNASRSIKALAPTIASPSSAPPPLSSSAIHARGLVTTAPAPAPAPAPAAAIPPVLLRNEVVATADRTRCMSMPLKKPVVGSQSDTCFTCEKKVFLVEKLEADGRVYHKNCFRCSECGKTVSLGGYAGIEGKIFCKPHFKQLFKLKGNYSEGFGGMQHKHKWDHKAGESNA